MEYNRSFENLLRGKVDEVMHKEGHTKDISGYPFPAGFEGDYVGALSRENLFRRYGTVVHAPEGDNSIIAVASSGSAELVESNMAYPISGDTVTEFMCSAYKLASLCKLKLSFIRDKKFDVSKYLKNEFARRFGRAEENIMLNGTGVNEPSGILKDAQIGCATASITYDDVIKLYFSVKPEYRRKAVWIVNDKTALALRTLKDENGNYLWNQANSTILDRPVVYSQYMPDADAGNKPIAFGDLSYVWMIERSPLMVRVLVEKYLLDDMYGYAANERFDCKLIRPEAVKVLKIA